MQYLAFVLGKSQIQPINWRRSNYTTLTKVWLYINDRQVCQSIDFQFRHAALPSSPARVPSKGQKIGDVKSINCKYKSGYNSCALHQPRHIHTQFGPISSMANKAPAFKSTFDVSTTFICVAMYFLPKSIPSNSNLGQVTNIRTHHTSQPTYLPIDQSVTETLNLIAPSRAVEGEKYTQQRQWDKFVWYCWSE